MPNIKSAVKRMRSDAKKQDRNHKVLSGLKTLDAKLKKLEKDPEQAKIQAAKLTRSYDSAANKGIIPRGRADRKKSRVAAFIARISK